VKPPAWSKLIGPCQAFCLSGRLDFTVVGPAVNEVSRIAGMCRMVDQPILASSAFYDALGWEKGRLVSVGRYALRGVGQPQDLYTLDRPK
jgi:adenylate cyclase